MHGDMVKKPTFLHSTNLQLRVIDEVLAIATVNMTVS
jgi:hypothetical protein